MKKQKKLRKRNRNQKIKLGNKVSYGNNDDKFGVLLRYEGNSAIIKTEHREVSVPKKQVKKIFEGEGNDR